MTICRSHFFLADVSSASKENGNFLGIKSALPTDDDPKKKTCKIF